MSLLEVDNLQVAYGQSQALFGVSLEVSRGELVSLVGRNGVGKSTTIRGIMGLNAPNKGVVRWKGKDISGRAPYLNCRDGIGYIPEDRRIFYDLSVWENLDVARNRNAASGSCAEPGSESSAGMQWNEEKVFDLFPELAELRHRRGGVLSGGQQQMLTIARSLMGNPELLLLDEPSEGLAPLVVSRVREGVALLKEAGLSIVLAEQNLDFVLSLSDRVYVLEKGQVKYTGSAEDLKNNTDVQKQYLTV